MPNIAILQANVVAALDQTELFSQDQQLLEEYARASAPVYCAGCAHACESALNDKVPVSDIMRYLMYHDECGNQKGAMRLFNDLPEQMRKRLMSINYAKAEQRCQQKMPIARLMRRAAEVLPGDTTRKA